MVRALASAQGLCPISAPRSVSASKTAEFRALQVADHQEILNFASKCNFFRTFRTRHVDDYRSLGAVGASTIAFASAQGWCHLELPFGRFRTVFFGFSTTRVVEMELCEYPQLYTK